MHEFAMGATSNNPHFGAVRNPWSLDAVPGGSSGGSASNVAAGATFASLGTDAGGSVRIPASLCGVVGIKPTYGRVSQLGLLSSAFNNDHVGPLTRSVRDNAILLQAIAGFDPLDATSAPLPVANYLYRINGSVKGLVAGIPVNYYFEGLDPDVDRAVKESIRALRDMGIETKEVSLPNLEYAGALRIISSVENVMMMDDVIRKHSKDIGPDVLFRMLPAQFVMAVDYARCLRVQRLIIDDFTKALADVDFIVTPTTPIPAFPIKADVIDVGETKISVKGPGRSSAILARNCFVGNHIGFPALTVPCGISGKGLPIGVQLIGRLFDEALLYRVAYHYEEVSAMKGKHPDVKTGNG
jgi:aspartyl-tRNA(Asn)/glutamyl-tRNA(Gln) amidotransferase subunit A